MAIAHVCLECGLDLAQHRARIEPHYGLPLVTCSRCGRSEVRRRHPIQRRWRDIRRLTKSLLVAAAQVVVILLLAGFTIMSANMHAKLIDPRRIMLLDDIGRAFAAIGLIMLPIVTGAWLGSALNHWPRKTQWLGWVVFVVAIGWIAPVAVHRMERVSPDRTPSLDWVDWRNSLAIFAIMCIISYAGLPVATRLRRIVHFNARQRWRKRRMRLRRSRSGT